MKIKDNRKKYDKLLKNLEELQKTSISAGLIDDGSANAKKQIAKGILHEFGGPSSKKRKDGTVDYFYVPPRPFMDITWKESSKKWGDLAKTEALKVFEFKKLNLKNVGEAMSKNIKTTLETLNGRVIPLSAIVIKDRQDDRDYIQGLEDPLIHTGAMRDHVNYAITKKK